MKTTWLFSKLLKRLLNTAAFNAVAQDMTDL